LGKNRQQKQQKTDNKRQAPPKIIQGRGMQACHTAYPKHIFMRGFELMLLTGHCKGRKRAKINQVAASKAPHHSQTHPYSKRLCFCLWQKSKNFPKLKKDKV